MLVNGGVVYSDFSERRVISLALGLAGACAIVVIGTLLAQAHWLDGLRYCGEHSIVIYLAFFLPMAATRTLLLKFGLIAASVRSRCSSPSRASPARWRSGGFRAAQGELPVRAPGVSLDRAEEG